MWRSETGLLLIALVTVSLAATGGATLLLARARRRYRKLLEDRRWLLEREREAAARTAVVAERARIARELHDIVSHKVSLMVVQATAAREVLAALPDAAETALQAVEGAGREAMTELRHLMGLLAPSPDGDDDRTGRDGEGDPSALAPQPSLSQLGTLVDRIAFAGLPVEVRISGEPRPLPPGIDVTAYRVVQEALTNALKYGDGGTATVMVRYADHGLRVEVLNSGPSVLSAGPGSGTGARSGGHQCRNDGAGHGLLGLRERVAVYGGHFDARRRVGGGYRVRARIPLERP